MGVNSLPKTVTGQRRGCDLNPGPSAPESSTLTTRLPEPAENSHTKIKINTERDTKLETFTQHAAVAAKLVNGPWCKNNRWAPYSHREKFH